MRKKLSYAGLGALLIGLGFVLHSKGVFEPRSDSSQIISGPKVGETAPDFETIDDRGQTVKLSAFIGKQPVALVFYPKDETSG